MLSRTLALGLVLGATAPAQETPAVASDATPQDVVRHQDALYAIDLPRSWRALGPNDAVALKGRLPVDMQEPLIGRITVFGDVTRWLDGGPTGGFDGEGLVVVREQFEHPVSEAEIATIRAFCADWKGPGGAHREILSADLATLGKDGHPAIEVRGRLLDGTPDGTPLETLDFYASTSGQRLILSFRASAARWAAAEPRFRALAASTVFARPPQPPSDLGDKLLWPIVLGSLTGISLIVLSKLRRRPAPPV